MATPTLVQHTSYGRENAVTFNPSLIITLPNPSLAGNALIVGVEGDASFTIGTPTDDKGNTWNAGPTINTAGQTVACFYALNCTAGTTKVTIPFTASTSSSISGVLSEFANVQTSGTIGPTGSVSHVTPVNITLSGSPTAGDLVWMWGADVASLQPELTSIGAGTNFTLLSANYGAGKFAQYSVTSTSTTAGVTTSGSDTFNAVALTLHSASAGTLPSSSGIRVISTQAEYFGATTHTTKIPCLGNLIVGLWTSEEETITGVSDSNGNTWHLGQSEVVAGVGVAQIFYSDNFTPGTDVTITLSYTSGGAGENFCCFYDIAGAASSPHDVDDARSGTQTTNTDLISGVITPSVANSLVLNVTTVVWHTITGMVTDSNGHTPTLTQQVNSKDDNAESGGTPPTHLSEDDGRAHFVCSDTTQVTFGYTTTSGTNPPTGVLGWESVTSVFKPGSASPLGFAGLITHLG